MPRVLCTLPNASAEISGVKFVSTADGGMLSEDLSDERAAEFAAIPGYTVTAQEPRKSQQQQPDPDGDELRALRARGVELGIPHADQMGAKRLKEEIPAAEKLAAEKKSQA